MKILFFIISLAGAAYLVASSLNADVFRTSSTNTALQSTIANTLESEESAQSLAQLEADISDLQAAQQSMLAQLEIIKNKGNNASFKSENEEARAANALPARAKTQSQATDTSVAHIASSEIAGIEHNESRSVVKLQPAKTLISDSSKESLMAIPQNNVQVEAQNTNNALYSATDSVNDAARRSQNKRLQQQALLRDLAQKRQFAALSALQRTPL
jgi:hypothetical protein